MTARLVDLPCSWQSVSHKCDCQHELLTLYVPVFNPETDALELEDQAKYYSYLAKSGLTGLVILGTNAETFLLTVSSQTQTQ